MLSRCVPRALLRAAAPLPAALPRLLRPVSTTAMDLRSGDVLDLDGALLRVEGCSFSRQAQGRPFVQMALRNLRTGTKKDLRLRSDETVEKAEMDVARYMRVLYTEGALVAVMEPTTFEQAELPLALFGERAPFIAEGMLLSVESYKGTPLMAHTPEKCEVEVAQVADAPADTANKGSVEAVLANGQRARVPRHVKVGDRVCISLTEGKVGAYLSKATAEGK